MRKIFIITALFLTLQSCSGKNDVGFYKGYETPIYQVEKQIGDFEFRNYKPILVAEVEVIGKRKEGAREGFMTLAKYIFGKNKTDQKVKMTSPVSQKEIPQEISITSKDNDQKTWLVQFSMPKKYNISNLPEPEDKRIKFKTLPAKRVVAIRFASLWRDLRINKEKKKLLNFVKANSLKTKGLPIITYYDDPFTFPWNRRNEIILELR